MGKWVVMLLLVVAAVQVEATFASSVGFSGRNADCTVCHAPAAPAATASLDGVPEAWWPGETYPLSARVSGGPLALPNPAPQGGFELEVEAGTLRGGQDMAGLLRFPDATVATYEPAGTLRRDWNLVWTAPEAHEPPAPVRLWLAVMAANGNHVMATNTSDGGEQGDAVATMQIIVPPAPDVVTAWEALPLQAPVIDRMETTSAGVRILGHHSDDNATHIGLRVAGGPWRSSPASGDWRVLVDGDPALVELRSEGTGRISPAVSPAATKATTGLGIIPILATVAWLSGRPPTECEPSCPKHRWHRP